MLPEKLHPSRIPGSADVASRCQAILGCLAQTSLLTWHSPITHRRAAHIAALRSSNSFFLSAGDTCAARCAPTSSCSLLCASLVTQVSQKESPLSSVIRSAGNLTPSVQCSEVHYTAYLRCTSTVLEPIPSAVGCGGLCAVFN